MSKGFMRVSREMMSEFEWLDNPNTFYVFMRLLFKANFKDSRNDGIEIKRGQLVTGRKSLSEKLNLSEQQIRTCLDKLSKTGYITINSTKRHSVITICDYDSWQDDYRAVQPTEQPTINQQLTNNQPTTNQQSTTIEINKEIEELKKENERLKEELAIASKKKTRNVSELDFSIVAPEFLDVVQDWLEYKKERRESYKSKGFSSFYKKLLELSHNNPATARKIIEQSKSNNYAGIFELKKREGQLPIGFILRDSEPGQKKNYAEWK